MGQGINLDNHTTTRPSNQTVAKMLLFLTERYGNLASPHSLGQQLYPAFEEALRGVYALAEARESDAFVFTSSGAEAVNQVILSTYFDVTIPMGKNQFITGAIDEAPAILSVSRLEQLSCLGKLAEANRQGQITKEAILEQMTPRTALVSLSWANGLTGVINPIQEIAALCQERGVLFHLEATHVLGKLFFDSDKLPANFLTFNGDHLHAPKGTGGLFIRDHAKCSPFIVGGIEQAGLRAGAVNLPACVALGQAAREMIDARDLVCTEIARLRDKFEKGLLNELPDACVFFHDVERLPNCSAIGFPGIVNESLLYLLNRKGVYATIGGGNYQQIGLILMASGIESSLAHSALSFSLSRETTENEIDEAIAIISESVKTLQKLSKLLYR